MLEEGKYKYDLVFGGNLTCVLYRHSYPGYGLMRAGLMRAVMRRDLQPHRRTWYGQGRHLRSKAVLVQRHVPALAAQDLLKIFLLSYFYDHLGPFLAATSHPLTPLWHIGTFAKLAQMACDFAHHVSLNTPHRFPVSFLSFYALPQMPDTKPRTDPSAFIEAIKMSDTEVARRLNARFHTRSGVTYSPWTCIPIHCDFDIAPLASIPEESADSADVHESDSEEDEDDLPVQA
ncbi:hypothetical protein VTO73DRAFT_3602 [Trametes versicolor]